MKKELRETQTLRAAYACGVCPPSLYQIWIGLLNSFKVIKGVPEIRAYDPGHAHLAVVLWSLHREAPSSMSVTNLKRIALFVQKLLGGPKFCPATDPLPRVAGWPKFNQLEMVTTFTYKPSLVRIDACNFELSWWPTHPHTHRQDRLQYTVPQLASTLHAV